MKTPSTPALTLALAVSAAACQHAPSTERSVRAPVASPRSVARAPSPTTGDAAAREAPPAAPEQTVGAAGGWRPPSSQVLAAMPLHARVELSIVPFDDATTLHVRTLFAEGARLGNRADVFAKLGDSITESGSFLSDIGHGWFDTGPWSRLDPVIQYFRRRSFTGNPENNSFSRASGAATAGWTASALISHGDQCVVEAELAAIHPAFAILMIGTNDAERSSAAVYERELREIARRVEARKVVLVLSTIPDQHTNDEIARRGIELNGVIRRVAWELHLPLVDYWAAMQGLPSQGIDPDRVHPSIYITPNGNVAAGVFSDAAVAFGYNMRNLTTVLMLERLVHTLDLHG